MLQFVQTVNSYLADYILIILLIGTGIYFTMRTRFVQIRCFGEGMKKVFGNFSLHGGKQHAGMGSTPHAHAIALIALGALVASAAKEGEAAWKSQKVNKN